VTTLIPSLGRRAYRPTEGGERVCHAHPAYVEGEMLAVTINSSKCVGGRIWRPFSSCLLESCVSLGEGPTIVLGGLRPMEEPKRCSIFSNRQHFALYVGRIGVACPLPGLIRPCWDTTPALPHWSQPSPPSLGHTPLVSFCYHLDNRMSG
jgi:hypothetical protein